FEQHLENKFVRQVINNTVLDTATTLVDRYFLRAYGSIQLAGCLALAELSGDTKPVFICADRDLLRAGESEGMQVLDPRIPDQNQAVTTRFATNANT
ncbi:MAG: hypothetical protein ACRD30_02550, partial [Bryobacteraceae bacterium]